MQTQTTVTVERVEATLAVEEDGEPVGELGLDQFVSDNGDGLTDVDKVDLCCMGIGDVLHFGFGFTVTRVA